MKYILSLHALLFLCCTSLFSQVMVSDGLHRVFLTKEDTAYEFYAIRPDKKIKVNSELMYHWYRPDTILITQGGFDGRLLEGSYKEFYASKNLKTQGGFLHGLKDGDWISWYPDGKLQATEHWTKGVLKEKKEKKKKETPAKEKASAKDKAPVSGKTPANDSVPVKDTISPVKRKS